MIASGTARLLRWDILGSLGHAEGLRRSRIITPTAHLRMQRLLRSALRSAEAGRLAIGTEHEDVHSAVELWLTRRDRRTGGMLHTGRSRNDQVALDVRLYLKDRVLSLHARATDLADVLVGFAAANRTALWPGYTHQRRAMPSSAGLWAGAYAEGLLDTIEAVAGTVAAPRPFAPRQRRRLRRTAAARSQGGGAGTRLPGPRPQRGRSAERARQAGGGGAALVHRTRS